MQSAHARLRVQLDRERFSHDVERRAVRAIPGTAHLRFAARAAIFAARGVRGVVRTGWLPRCERRRSLLVAGGEERRSAVQRALSHHRARQRLGGGQGRRPRLLASAITSKITATIFCCGRSPIRSPRSVDSPQTRPPRAACGPRSCGRAREPRNEPPHGATRDSSRHVCTRRNRRRRAGSRRGRGAPAGR
jgi:hypothetical protein